MHNAVACLSVQLETVSDLTSNLQCTTLKHIVARRRQEKQAMASYMVVHRGEVEHCAFFQMQPFFQSEWLTKKME